ADYGVTRQENYGLTARATVMTNDIARISLIPNRSARSSQSDHDKLVKQAQIWVSQTFFGTLLKQMRQSPFKSEMFSGGRGGEAFSSLYDQQLAQRMARGAGHKLVNSIVRKIEARSAYAQSRAQVSSDQ